MTYQEDADFSLRISRVAHVPRVFTLDVLDRRPLFRSRVMDSFSTSGSIAVPKATQRSLKHPVTQLSSFTILVRKSDLPINSSFTLAT